MPNVKPLVSVAAVCEQVLEEKDRVLSAIRLVDTFYVAPPPPDFPAGTTPGIDLKVLVSLKSGDLTGTHDIRLVLRTPSGRLTEVHKAPMVFNGGEHGVNWTIRFMMPAKEFGLFWFDVMFGDDVLTSVPLKLVLGPPTKSVDQ
jgi:hypothetical protein